MWWQETIFHISLLFHQRHQHQSPKNSNSFQSHRNPKTFFSLKSVQLKILFVTQNSIWNVDNFNNVSFTFEGCLSIKCLYKVYLFLRNLFPSFSTSYKKVFLCALLTSLKTIRISFTSWKLTLWGKGYMFMWYTMSWHTHTTATITIMTMNAYALTQQLTSVSVN